MQGGTSYQNNMFLGPPQHGPPEKKHIIRRSPQPQSATAAALDTTMHICQYMPHLSLVVGAHVFQEYGAVARPGWLEKEEKQQLSLANFDDEGDHCQFFGTGR